MLQAELRKIYLTQLEKLQHTDDGTYRDALADIPEIKTHAFVVCGVRRCGKSTLLQQFVKKLNKPFFYLNFDDLRLLEFSVSDYAVLDAVIDESGSRLIFFLMKYKLLHTGSCMCGKSLIKAFRWCLPALMLPF